MSDDWDLGRILEKREPPPGGLPKLRARLARRARGRRRLRWAGRWGLAAVAVVAVVLTLGFFREPAVDPTRLFARSASAVALGLVEAESEREPQSLKGGQDFVTVVDTDQVAWYQAVSLVHREPE